MSSRPAIMAKAARTGAAPLRRGLPQEILVWEILVRLPPKALLRCQAVCRAWRRVTSTRHFLLAHHGHLPSLPLVTGRKYGDSFYKYILPFDHRTAAAAQLQPVARLDDTFYLRASCDGLLILLKCGMTGTCFSICNPATHQHAPLRPLLGFTLLGMYPHRPTSEYRLLLYRRHMNSMRADLITACYVFALGSVQPPRCIGIRWPEAASACFDTPVLVPNAVSDRKQTGNSIRHHSRVVPANACSNCSQQGQGLSVSDGWYARHAQL